MLSIIIVNFRTWQFTQRAVDFLKTSLPSDAQINRELEIVIVDNHSNDGNLQGFIDRNPEVRVYLSEGNYGYSHGCNQGALHARGDWLLFMNPDVLADWSSLSRLLTTAKSDHKHSIYTGRQVNDAGKPQRTFAPFTSAATVFPLFRILLRIFNPKKYPNARDIRQESESLLTVDWVSGSLLLVDSRDFEKLKGWDEDFWLYCEDEDICKRALNIGLLSAQYNGATFTHSHAASTRTNSNVRVLAKSEAIISKYVYISKHFSGTKRKLVFNAMNARNLFRLLIWTTLHFLCLGLAKKVKEKQLIYRRVAAFIGDSRQSLIILSDKSKNYRATKN
jgi:GT2 family glycosyltransferase